MFYGTNWKTYITDIHNNSLFYSISFHIGDNPLDNIVSHKP